MIFKKCTNSEYVDNLCEFIVELYMKVDSSIEGLGVELWEALTR